MAQLRKVSRNNTRIVKDVNGITVTLHSTIVFEKNGPKIWLNTGGFNTNTTRDRINQCANEYCDGAFSVSRAGGVLSIHFRGVAEALVWTGDSIEFSI